jgi:hypothetical protein
MLLRSPSFPVLSYTRSSQGCPNIGTAHIAIVAKNANSNRKFFIAFLSVEGAFSLPEDVEEQLLF